MLRTPTAAPGYFPVGTVGGSKPRSEIRTPPEPKPESSEPTASNRITATELRRGSRVVLDGSGRTEPAMTTRPSESTAMPARTKLTPGSDGIATAPSAPKLRSTLPFAARRTIFVLPATTSLWPGAEAISIWPAVNWNGTSYLMPRPLPLCEGKAIVALPLVPKLRSSRMGDGALATAVAAFATVKRQVRRSSSFFMWTGTLLGEKSFSRSRGCILASQPNVIHTRHGQAQPDATDRADGVDRRRGLGRPHGLRRRRPLAPPRPPPAAAGGGDDRGRGAARPGAGPSRPLGRAAHRGRGAGGPVLRPGLLPRAGPALADGLLPSRRRRTGGGDGRARRACGRPVDADAGYPADRPARGGAAGSRAARQPRALLRRRQPGRCRRAGAAVRAAGAAPGLRAVDPLGHPQPRQAAGVRPLDQLGAGAAALGHGPRAGSGAGGPARPRLPRRQPSRRPERLQRRRDAAGRADRQRPPLDRPGRRGLRLEQLGCQRRPLRHRLAADSR